jgi:hypothetical protein
MFRHLKTGSAKKCNRAVEVYVNFNPEDIAFWFGLAEVSTNTGAAQIGQAGVPIVIKFVVCTTEDSEHFHIKSTLRIFPLRAVKASSIQGRRG